MITVGLLYDAQNLLAKVRSSAVTATALVESFKRLEVADFQAVLKLAQQCQWVEVTSTDILALGANGRKIHETGDAELQLRHQIRDILSFVSPSWAKKIADGRSEAMKTMPDTVQQIFSEAGLLGAWTDELVEWWDSIGLAARSRRNEANLKTGRRAEKLSIEYEEGRTGRRPEWTCVNSNYAGFDLLSVVGKDDLSPCAIEVKSSTQRKNEASFFVTRNEWSVAESNPNYRLHLWLIRDGEHDVGRDLRVITSQMLAKHIPTDLGHGKWETARLPFSSFW